MKRNEITDDEAFAAAQTLKAYCQQQRRKYMGGCNLCIFIRKGGSGFAPLCKLDKMPICYNLTHCKGGRKK